jgi:hypothetical protein
LIDINTLHFQSPQFEKWKAFLNNYYFHSMKKSVRLSFMLMTIFLSYCGMAQSNKPKGISTPDWVKAMADPNANYYNAIKEYEAFWKAHEKPADEEHSMNKGTEEVKEHIKKLSKREIRHQREMDYYRYQCKRFENWQRENKAYVQPDGHILSADERLKQWQQSQKERQ